MASVARDIALASSWLLLAVGMLTVSGHILESFVEGVHERWQKRQRKFEACGRLHVDGRPCLLPIDHDDTEHATAWTVLGSRERRTRWDDTGDREELRAARGQLPPVSRTGEVITTK